LTIIVCTGCRLATISNNYRESLSIHCRSRIDNFSATTARAPDDTPNSTTTTTTTTNGKHIDLAATVHSKCISPNVLKRMNLVLNTRAISERCNCRPAARVNAAACRTQETHYLTRMMS
jgi:hypothetical protein